MPHKQPVKINLNILSYLVKSMTVGLCKLDSRVDKINMSLVAMATRLVPEINESIYRKLDATVSKFSDRDITILLEETSIVNIPGIGACSVVAHKARYLYKTGGSEKEFNDIYMVETSLVDKNDILIGHCYVEMRRGLLDGDDRGAGYKLNIMGNFDESALDVLKKVGIGDEKEITPRQLVDNVMGIIELKKMEDFIMQKTTAVEQSGKEELAELKNMVVKKPIKVSFAASGRTSDEDNLDTIIELTRIRELARVNATKCQLKFDEVAELIIQQNKQLPAKPTASDIVRPLSRK